MSKNRLHPVIRWSRKIALGVFVLTTWTVAIFFLIDFWPMISHLNIMQVILALGSFTIIGILIYVLRTLKIITIKQVIQFCSALFFFLAIAVLYSYVGLKIGLFVRDLIGFGEIESALR